MKKQHKPSTKLFRVHNEYHYTTDVIVEAEDRESALRMAIGMDEVRNEDDSLYDSTIVEESDDELEHD